MKTQTLDELMGKITNLPWMTLPVIYPKCHEEAEEDMANDAYKLHAANNFPKLVEVGKGNLDFMKSLRNYFVNMKRQTTVLIDHEIEKLEAALAAANEIKE